jgi:hypothetical protein
MDLPPATLDKLSARDRGNIQLVVLNQEGAVLHRMDAPFKSLREGVVATGVVPVAAKPGPANPVPPDRPGPSPDSPQGSISLDDIDGLGPARTRKLVEAGITSPQDLVKTDPARLEALFGQATSRRILKNAQAALRKRSV